MAFFNKMDYNSPMSKRAIYFDTETTGLDTNNDRIIEIAAYDPVRDKTFCSFVNPNIPIPPEIVRICNITEEMVKDAPDFTKVGADFLAFCEGDVVLIAHNGQRFDLPLLEQECKRSSLELPKFPLIDTLVWAKKFRPDLPKYTLQYLRQTYGIAENNAHRALDDVIVLKSLFEKMIEDLSMEEVLDLLLLKPKAMVMPFGKHRGVPLNKLPKNYITWLAGSGAFDKKENEELRAALIDLNLLSV